MKKAAIILALSSLPLTHFAQSDDYYEHSEEHIDFARVIDVRPIYETVSYTKPHQECRYEERVVHRGGSKTPVILGAIIGGAIGNELGTNDKNKKYATAAGAILGSSIGQDYKRQGQRHYTKSERVCSTTHRVSYKEEITGYNVTYKYRGRQYDTTMGYDPGERIRVAVSVRPVDA